MTRQNPFNLFELQAQWDIDQASLHKRFVAASAKNHPDRFTDALDQADAAAKSAEVNEAYQTLRDDESRANALWEILGGSGKGDDKSLPPNLLMEMMETREEMEEAIADDDTATLERLGTWAGQQRADHLHRVGALLNEAASHPPAERDPTLRQVRLELNALRYFQRMLQQMP